MYSAVRLLVLHIKEYTYLLMLVASLGHSNTCTVL